jgi:hypothetical protein
MKIRPVGADLFHADGQTERFYYLVVEHGNCYGSFIIYKS